MNSYETLVELIKDIAGRIAAPTPLLGVVSGRGKIKVDGMELDQDDYLINCNLRLDDKEKVYLHKEKPFSGEYMSDTEHNGSLKEYKENILQNGDNVLLVKLQGFEQYVVIAKVVKPT